MSLSPEVFDFDRVTRQMYQENPKKFSEFPNLSELQLIGASTQERLYRHFLLPCIPSGSSINRRTLKRGKEHTMASLFRNARETSELLTSMEGPLEQVIGDYVWNSIQGNWGQKEEVLFASGVGFLIKAVQIECGDSVLETFNALDAAVLRRIAQKVTLPFQEASTRRKREFPPFPLAQTRLNTTIGYLGDVVCDTGEERFALESGASGMYYIIEGAEEYQRGLTQKI